MCLISAPSRTEGIPGRSPSLTQKSVLFSEPGSVGSQGVLPSLTTGEGRRGVRPRQCG